MLPSHLAFIQFLAVGRFGQGPRRYTGVSKRKKLQSSSSLCQWQDPKAERSKWLVGHGCRSSYVVQGYEGVLVQTTYRPGLVAVSVCGRGEFKGV